MKYRAAHCCMKGGRSYNEDSVRFESNGPSFAGIVADGLGGHGGGEIASSLVAETLAGGFMAETSTQPEAIHKLFEKANQEVVSKQTATLQMKSTAVGLFCDDNGLTCAHVGDSRLYRFTNGMITFQTKDHSVSQMAVLSGEIPPSQIRFHEDRNKVLRALGSDASVKPDIISWPRQTTDTFLLCTDGFWEYVLEEEMEIDLAKSKTPDEWLRFMIGRLSKRVHGKNDNFSALAIFMAHDAIDITIKEW